MQTISVIEPSPESDSKSESVQQPDTFTCIFIVYLHCTVIQTVIQLCICIAVSIGFASICHYLIGRRLSQRVQEVATDNSVSASVSVWFGLAAS